MSKYPFPAFFNNRVDFSDKIKSGRPSVIDYSYSANTMHGCLTITETEPVRIFQKLSNNKENRKSRTAIYINVNCSCGNNLWVKASYLKRKPIACRACRAQRRKGIFKKLPIEFKKWYTRYHEIKRRARKEKIPFNLTPEYLKELYELQSGACAITGEKIEDIKGNLNLDRIIPVNGYVVDNVQWTCRKANMIKQELTMDEFVNYCYKITLRFKNQFPI